MRVAKHRLTMLEDRGAGAPVEAALAAASVAGVAALLASSSLASAGTKPLSQSIKTEAGLLARGADNVVSKSEPRLALSVETDSVGEDKSQLEPERSVATGAVEDVVRHVAPAADNVVLRMELPTGTASKAARPSLDLATHEGRPVLRMPLPESIVVNDVSQVPTVPAKPDYQRPEPVLRGRDAPMVVVARIDLPPARPIEDDIPEPVPGAASQIALVEQRAIGSVTTPLRVELNLADPDRSPTPTIKPEPVLVASIDDIERQLSFAAGFDLRNLDRIAADDVPAAGSIEVTKTVLANGRSVGAVPLRIAPDSTVSIRLGDLVELFRGQMNSRNFAALDASVRANTFVSFRRLRAAGIGVRYDPVLDSISMSVET